MKTWYSAPYAALVVALWAIEYSYYKVSLQDIVRINAAIVYQKK